MLSGLLQRQAGSLSSAVPSTSGHSLELSSGVTRGCRWPGIAAAPTSRRASQRQTPCIRLVPKSIADGHDANRLKDCDTLELETFLQAYRERREGVPSAPGEVYLVGTGPGDPGLLTLRAAQLMGTADVVLYDRLVSDEIMQLVNPGARMVYVGKTAGYHTRRQEEIHELLLAFAEAGAMVVRLKGGDPYVFGRGGEEVAYLTQHGIRVHCVPGITAAAGICAELGIPLTHRGVATSARFLTGHSREGGEEALDEAVAAAADEHTTLIVYMGLQTLAKLAQQLTASGLPACTPAVAVERGTTSQRRVVYGTIAELHGLATQAGLRTPTLILIGNVVALSPGWVSWQAAGRPLEWNEASLYPPLQLQLSLDLQAQQGQARRAGAAAGAAAEQGGRTKRGALPAPVR